jgi:hypothetical protein
MDLHLPRFAADRGGLRGLSRGTFLPSRQAGGNEVAEQRMRVIRPRLEFGMELRAQVEWVIP